MDHLSKRLGVILCFCLLAAGDLTPIAVARASARETRTRFRSYWEAKSYVRSHYHGESLDTSRSSWITSAEYYYADGRGYMILGMRGRPYIFMGVPRPVWEGFKSARSLGRYYHANIRGRYRLDLGR